MQVTVQEGDNTSVGLPSKLLYLFWFLLASSLPCSTKAASEAKITRSILCKKAQRHYKCLLFCSFSDWNKQQLNGLLFMLNLLHNNTDSLDWSSLYAKWKQFKHISTSIFIYAERTIYIAQTNLSKIKKGWAWTCCIRKLWRYGLPYIGKVCKIIAKQYDKFLDYLETFPPFPSYQGISMPNDQKGNRSFVELESFNGYMAYQKLYFSISYYIAIWLLASRIIACWEPYEYDQNMSDTCTYNV